MIYIGIDDTDTKDSPGTNQLARRLLDGLHCPPHAGLVVRHQLLIDPRIPFTSKNGSASIILLDGAATGGLLDFARAGMRAAFVDGSDPGLALTRGEVPGEVVRFARRCQTEVVQPEEAYSLAARCGVHLEGLGGTCQGVVGALAAVGHAADGNDGRVVHIASWPWPDDFSGPQRVGALMARGVHEIRELASGAPVFHGTVDIGKRLRPSRREARVVLYVRRIGEAGDDVQWEAVKLP